MYCEIDGIEYILHSCLNGSQFWMPLIVRELYWATDFWDLDEAIEYTGGLPCE